MEKGLRWPDVLLPVAITVLGAVELAVSRFTGWPAGIALEVVSGALLVLRRRHALWASPLAAGVLLAMPWVGPHLDQPATPILFLAVACYALARWLSDLRGLVGIALMVLLLIGDYAFA